MIFKRNAACLTANPKITTANPVERPGLDEWRKQVNFGKSYSSHTPLTEAESLDPDFIVNGKEYQIKKAIKNRANADLINYN